MSSQIDETKVVAYIPAVTFLPGKSSRLLFLSTYLPFVGTITNSRADSAFFWPPNRNDIFFKLAVK